MIDGFFNEVDKERQSRARELLNLLDLYRGIQEEYLREVVSKSVIVLSYAHWEGFYNQCVDAYIKYLIATNKKVVDVSWLALVGCVNASLESMKDKNHSLSSKVSLIKQMKEINSLKFDVFDLKFVKSQSNLNFERLRSNLEILEINEQIFLPHRNKIDKELVGWRHSVAHGDNPNLTELDSEKHIDFCNNLLLIVSDAFQKKALQVF